MANTRKAVLFIVEGLSDKDALEKIFRTLYKKDRTIEFRVTDGDITSDPEITITNVEDKIKEIIRRFLSENKLKATDIFQVIQLFDMDGAYIDDSFIVQDKVDDVVYSPENIRCKYRPYYIGRNQQKRELMNYLLSLEKIGQYSYEKYFMSSNLDHALYNAQNLSKELKQKYADAFYEKFLGKEALFCEFLRTDVVNGVPDNMDLSWRFIKAEKHSLERHTNLHIYFLLHPVLP